MARKVPRNEWGFTAHQQKRYDVILNNMESTFVAKRQSSNDYRYNPARLELNLKRNMNVANTLCQIDCILSKVQELKVGIQTYMDFNGKENDIKISEDDANEYLSAINTVTSESYSLERKLSNLHNHAVKLKRRKEIEGIKVEEFNREETMKDLLGLDKEFVSMKFNTKSGRVYAETEDVILTDGHDNKINLGPFHLSYATKDRYLTVRARAKKPQRHQRSNHFHPHVRPNGDICLGDGGEMLQKAHERGDMFTIFVTLKNLINTYNPGSPYAKLETWIGKPCAHCNINVSQHRLKKCTLCGDEVCSSCITTMTTDTLKIKRICSTCQSEEQNKCIGIADVNDTCHNYVDGREGKTRCYYCEEKYKELTEEKKETEEVTLEEIEAVNNKTCIACGQKSEDGYTATCSSCKEVFFCPDCAKPNECEFCKEIICPACMAPCSQCKINTHIECMKPDINGNLKCTTCQE